MIFKVLYQENANEVPVRENTKALYLEAESEREARKKLADRNILIEYILPVTGKYLEYEKNSVNFKLE